MKKSGLIMAVMAPILLIPAIGASGIIASFFIGHIAGTANFWAAPVIIGLTVALQSLVGVMLVKRARRKS